MLACHFIARALRARRGPSRRGTASANCGARGDGACDPIVRHRALTSTCAVCTNELVSNRQQRRNYWLAAGWWVGHRIPDTDWNASADFSALGTGGGPPNSSYALAKELLRGDVCVSRTISPTAPCATSPSSWAAGAAYSLYSTTLHYMCTASPVQSRAAALPRLQKRVCGCPSAAPRGDTGRRHIS